MIYQFFKNFLNVFMGSIHFTRRARKTLTTNELLEKNVLVFSLSLFLALLTPLHQTPLSAKTLLTTHHNQVPAEQRNQATLCTSLDDLATATFTHLHNALAQAALPFIKPPLVIFDIDDTAITLEKKSEPSSRAQKKMRTIPIKINFVAIKPILNLYKSLLAIGYKIAFVTWRTDTPSARAKTLQQLRTCGYNTFEELYMRPSTWTDSRPKYKEYARTLLANKFSIFATLDDRYDNFQGAHTGNYIIWIPRNINESP